MKRIQSYINILAILLILYAVYFIFNQYKSALNIAKNKGVVVGSITDYYVVFPENRYLEFRFGLLGRNYYSKEQIPLGVASCWKKGDLVKIEYFKEDPSQCQIDFDCKLSQEFKIGDSIKCESCY